MGSCMGSSRNFSATTARMTKDSAGVVAGPSDGPFVIPRPLDLPYLDVESVARSLAFLEGKCASASHAPPGATHGIDSEDAIDVTAAALECWPPSLSLLIAQYAEEWPRLMPVVLAPVTYLTAHQVAYANFHKQSGQLVQIKVVLVGDTQTGKSRVLSRMMGDSAVQTKSTIVFDLVHKQLRVADRHCKLMVTKSICNIYSGTLWRLVWWIVAFSSCCFVACVPGLECLNRC